MNDPAMHKPLEAIDKLFVRMESKQRPMHGAVVYVFSSPPEVDDFVSRVYAEMQQSTIEAPFDRRVDGASSWRSMRWVSDESFSMEHHVRRWTIDAPGRWEHALAQIEAIHSEPLDWSRPLWQLHFIEGLEDGRFVVVFKAHHALFDGVRWRDLTRWWFEPQPGRAPRLPWRGFGQIMEAPKQRKTKAPRRRWALIRRIARVVRELPGLIFGLAEAGKRDPSSRRATTAPACILNGAVGTSRLVGTIDLPEDALRRVAKERGATLNDLVLAVCGGGIRRYLSQRDALPDRSLIVSVPVMVSRQGAANNSFSYINVELGTTIDDGLERLDAIASMTRRSKEVLARVSAATALALTVLGLGLSLVLSRLARLGLRSPVNLSISNVMFTKDHDPIYWGDAKLETVYPIFNLIRDQTLNLMVTNYRGMIRLGVVACPTVIPDLQRLCTYIEDAADELLQEDGADDPTRHAQRGLRA